MVSKLDCTVACGDAVEFGCGYGTFTIPAARLIKGCVYAIDIDPELTTLTSQKAELAGLNNIQTIHRDFVMQGTGLLDAQVGYAMLFNILHIENPVGLLKEAHRVLKTGGGAAIIHWRTDVETPRGPSMPIRPTAEQCRAWSEQAGLEFVRYESLCCCSWHWGLIMRKPETGGEGDSQSSSSVM